MEEKDPLRLATSRLSDKEIADGFKARMEAKLREFNVIADEAAAAGFEVAYGTPFDWPSRRHTINGPFLLKRF
jgi:hypothetical protein